jgi:hypothetical protein
VEGRRVDENRRQRELERDAPEQQTVAEDPDRAQRGALGARGEGRPDLPGPTMPTKVIVVACW